VSDWVISHTRQWRSC